MKWLIACLALAATPASGADLWVFTQEGCAPCKLLKDELHNGLAEGFDLYIIDISQFPAMGAKHGITKVPTSIVFEGKREKRRRVGYSTKESYQSWLTPK